MNDECHDCGVKEGQLHKSGCDVEICPYCSNQAIGCSCNEKYPLVKEPRELFIIKPIICARCGDLYPDFFIVEDNEWEKIIGITYKDDDILCESCYDYIRILRKISKGIRRQC